ncbi:MAG: polysaccharide deacetylase family protein [Deltaproteobacteria bacterium]|nr:polysaccharide deacetylase family protein [Deltaproteobacteria bacterium]
MMQPAYRVFARNASAAALRFGGISWLVRNTYGRHKVGILVYHDPSPETLRAHLEWLRPRFSVIPLDTLVDALHCGDWSAVPPKAVVLTFDDGHRGNAALTEVLRAFSAPATFYLCSGVVDTHHHFWFKEVPWARGYELISLVNSDRVAQVTEESGWTPQRDYPERQAMNLEELRALGEVASLEAHTRTHPVLTTCTDEELVQEIPESRRELEALLGRQVRHFAFPNGDYTPRVVEVVKRAGFRSARTVDFGWNGPGTDPYHLRVLGGGDGVDVTNLSALMSGLSTGVRYAIKGWSGGKKPPITPTGG